MYRYVSIILPNWNGKEIISECINSLRKLEYPKDKLELIVCDNGSTDGSQKVIKYIYSRMKDEGWLSLKLIKNYKNFGPSIARNKAINAANEKSNYIWSIDNDIIVDKYALIELLKISEKFKEIGIIGSSSFYYDKPNEIWFYGNNINWKTFSLKNVKIKNIPKSKFFDVDTIPGNSLLIKRETLQKIGLFDPDYFCYYNEIDLCVRAKKTNYRVCISTQSKVWHKVSATTKKIKGFELFFKSKNLILLFRKNANFLKFMFFSIFLIIYYIPKTTLTLFLNKQTSMLKFYYNGIKEGYIRKLTYKA